MDFTLCEQSASDFQCFECGCNELNGEPTEMKGLKRMIIKIQFWTSLQIILGSQRQPLSHMLVAPYAGTALVLRVLLPVDAFVSS